MKRGASNVRGIDTRRSGLVRALTRTALARRLAHRVEPPHTRAHRDGRAAASRRARRRGVREVHHGPRVPGRRVRHSGAPARMRRRLGHVQRRGYVARWRQPRLFKAAMVTLMLRQEWAGRIWVRLGRGRREG